MCLKTLRSLATESHRPPPIFWGISSVGAKACQMDLAPVSRGPGKILTFSRARWEMSPKKIGFVQNSDRFNF
jgi:hypothetical protein